MILRVAGCGCRCREHNGAPDWIISDTSVEVGRTARLFDHVSPLYPMYHYSPVHPVTYCVTLRLFCTISER